ncbi:MAG: glycosyltransferase [Nitrososphaerota archaeon]|nr:glycosyltransferase [Nitrososphaerota archaeon]
MPRILYGISPIGLGHATRSSVIVEELRRNGAEVRVFSGGRAAEFLRERGLGPDDVVDEAVPRVDGLEMYGVSLWYARSWLAQRRNVPRVKELVGRFRPDILVCDEEFSGMAAAGEAGLKRAFIADELLLGFARGWLARKIEGRVERWYAGLLASADLVIVPEEGEDGANRRYVGPIVRRPTMPAEEVRKRFGFPEGRLVLFSMSGSGIGRELGSRLLSALDADPLRDATLVVTGNRGKRFEGPRVRDLGVVGDNQDLVACADLVVSTAGKSTIDEAASSGTPIVVIPIRHHAEQERNAADLGYDWEDMARLGELVEQKIGRRSAPREYRGEEAAARHIMAVAQAPRQPPFRAGPSAGAAP